MNTILWSQSPYRLIEVTNNGFKTKRTEFVCDLINKVTKEDFDYVVYVESDYTTVTTIKVRCTTAEIERGFKNE
jgi:hypothetical protein